MSGGKRAAVGKEAPRAPDSQSLNKDIQGLLALYGAGKYNRAEVRARRLIRACPGILGLYDVMSAAQVGQGKLEEAAQTCRRALELDPGHVGAHNNLGIILRKLGRLDEATASCRQALSIDPAHVEARINLGAALRELGSLEEAVDCYREALASSPDRADAHSNLGNALKDLGRFEEAVACHRQAVALMPNSPEVHNNLGNALAKLGRFDDAAASFAHSLRINPHSVDALSGFAAALHNVTHIAGDADFTDLIVRCFESSTIGSQLVRAASHTILRSRLAAWLDADTVTPDDLASLDPWTSRLLVAHLRHTLIADSGLEMLLSRVRGGFLDRWREAGAKAKPDGAGLHLLAALAYQGFLNEYVWHVTEAELACADDLEEELAGVVRAGSEPGAPDLYLLAAFRPLYGIEDVRSWALEHHGTASPELQAFLKKVILDPHREKDLARGMPRLTSIDDGVSRAVREQYEENPYPRWDSLSAGTALPYTEHILKGIAPNRPALEPTSTAPDVLIAGCGTGKHPILSALTYQNSRVLAVDLSRSSLAFAKRKAEELGVANITFAQADILKLGALEGTFDVIECGGVLHHMEDPEAGLIVLLERLKPGGYLGLGLYSELARQFVVRCRQLVADQTFAPNLQGIRDFRRYVREGGNPDVADLEKANDFFATSPIRDLLFHVQEHRFTIPRIRKLLSAHDLEFLGFVFENVLLKIGYRAMFPDDRDCLDLENWHRFECENPATFVSMYQFWCRKAS